MKKTYTTPMLSVITLASEGMIASSIKVDRTKTGSTMLTNRNGWDSANWADDGDNAED